MRESYARTFDKKKIDLESGMKWNEMIYLNGFLVFSLRSNQLVFESQIWTGWSFIEADAMRRARLRFTVCFEEKKNNNWLLCNDVQLLFFASLFDFQLEFHKFKVYRKYYWNEKRMNSRRSFRCPSIFYFIEKWSLNMHHENIHYDRGWHSENDTL